MTKPNWLTQFVSDLWRDERGEVGVAEPEVDDTASDADPDPDPEPDPEPEPETISKAEYEKRVKELEDIANERLELAQHWKNQADSKATPEPEADDDGDPGDFVEDINNRGPKAIREFLKREGFVSKNEVDSLVDAKAKSLLEQDKLQQDYPLLNDDKSEFFKTTAKHWQALEGRNYPQAERTRIAAEKAELELRRTGKWEDPQSESERQQHITAQGGAKGRKTTPPAKAALNATQKAMAAALGMSQKDQEDVAKRSQRMLGG